MSPSATNANDDSVRIHQIVAFGSLEQLQAALLAGAAVDAPGHLGITPLMLAIDMKVILR